MKKNLDLLYELRSYFEHIKRGKSHIAYQKVQDLVHTKRAELKNMLRANRDSQLQYHNERQQLEELVMLQKKLELIEKLNME